MMKTNQNNQGYSTSDYWVELRKRLLNCLFVIIFIFCISCFFANDLYNNLTLPLLQYLPNSKALIATHITAPFLVPFRLSFAAACFLAAPYVLYQLWCFVAPALYQEERRFVWVLFLMSIVLFYIGIAFAYWVVFPCIFKFLVHTAPKTVEVRPDIGELLDFCLKLLFAFGAAFEVPIVTLVLIQTGVSNAASLKEKRSYVVIAAFIIGMLLAPDVLTQIFIAIPLWLLFELGLVLSRFICFQKKVSA